VLLTKDPRYKEFAQKYAFDLARFAVEVVGMTPTQQQMELFESVEGYGSRTSVRSGHGCFGIDTPIMMADGCIKKVQDIVVCDELMGADGNSVRNVLRLYRGQEKLYQFTYSDGESHVFNESHILCLVATNSKGTRKTGDKKTVTVKEWLTWGYDKKRCHAIYREKVSTFKGESKHLPIPPYIFGVWIGDGSKGRNNVTTMDDEIKKELERYAHDIGCDLVVHGKKGMAETLSITKRSNSGFGCFNPMKNALKELDLMGEKNIPDIYLKSDYHSRLELLAGMIDTDGHLSNKASQFEITQKSESIANSIVFLARSVGCKASIRKVKKECVNNGVWGIYFRVVITRNIELIPTRLPRKQVPSDKVKQRPNLHFGIKSCESIGVGNYYGFELDGDHKFLGGDFTVLHNSGKSRSLAVISLWHLLCYIKSNTMITAPKIEQVRNVAWKEIADVKDLMLKGCHPWIVDYITIEAERVYIKGYKAQWFIFAKTAPRGSPENLAGMHRDFYLLIADEASGIPDQNYAVMTGALTDWRNRMVMLSQPTRPSGFFYDSHHKLSSKNDGVWHAIRMDSRDSPLVSPQFIAEKKEEYSEEEFQIKVLGEFPELRDGYLLGRSHADYCIGREVIKAEGEEYGLLLLVDVGAGEYRDKSVAIVAKVTGVGEYGENARRVQIVDVPIYTNTRNLQDFTGDLIQIAALYENITIAVDAGGMGVSVCQSLENNYGEIVRVKWGSPCFSNQNRERYVNKRSQAIVAASRAAKEGRLGVVQGRHVKDLLDQMSRVPYHYDEKARYQVEKKEKMREEGIPSPDLWDAICFAFMEGMNYNIYEGSLGGSIRNSAADKALGEADAMFSDL
jgi:hypothetical protein